MGINDAGTTLTRARLNVLAYVSPPSQNRNGFCIKRVLGMGRPQKSEFGRELFKFAKKAIRRWSINFEHQ
jgi:hypothetical protein